MSPLTSDSPEIFVSSNLFGWLKKTAKKTGLLTSRVHRKTISKSKKRYVYSINNVYIYTHHIITYFIYIHIIYLHISYIYIYHIPFLKLTVSHLKIDAWNSIPSFWGAVLLAGATVKRTWTTWISTPKLRPNWASNCINQYQHANHEIKSDGSCKIFFRQVQKVQIIRWEPQLEPSWTRAQKTQILWWW